ncbi:MAG: flagellar protein FlgN [Colwellia sp.]|nr:flagellar protein FlgN [Colwellia sp.]
MTNTPSAQQLVDKQLSQLQALHNLLNSEKEILQQHEPDALVEVTQNKNSLLVEIQTLDLTISRSVEFAQNKAAGEFQQELNDIKILLLSCQELNSVNGQIIQHSQLAVERMKTSLLESHNRSAITYDGKGKTSASLSSLDLKA